MGRIIIGGIIIGGIIIGGIIISRLNPMWGFDIGGIKFSRRIVPRSVL